MKGLYAIALGITAIFCLCAIPAGAEGTGETKLETITVTAQKQEENIQDVPMSISVFGEQDIEDMKIESVLDLADFVPNLLIENNGVSGMNTPSMRGVVADIQLLSVSTGLYVDGVALSAPLGYDNEMLDIQRIEVLKGPQGTLYGKGAQAGVINIITRQPGNEFVGKVSVQGAGLLSGETDDNLKRKLTLNLSGPIVKDKFYYAVAGQYFKKDGFIENTVTGEAVDDRENRMGRMNLRWTPSEKVDISLIASHNDVDDGDINGNFTPEAAAMFGLPAPQDRKVASEFQGYHDLKDRSQSLKVAYSLNDDYTLTSVTTNWNFEMDSNQDWDFNPGTMTHIRTNREFKTISQELRLDYSRDRLKWLTGLYFDRKDYDQGGLRETFMGDIPFRQITQGDTYACFANLTYPFTGKLSLITGLRYEKEELEFDDGSALKIEDSWDALTPKIALNYRFAPEIMAYVSAAKGYRSGGVNWYAAGNPDVLIYDQEELWSYDLGIKTNFFNNRLTLNATLYYMNISDMQVSEALSPIEIFTTNAAEATGKGVELEMSARLSKGLSMMLGFGYNDIEFDEFSDALGDYSGNKAPYAPEYTANIGAQYRHPVGFYGRVDLIFNGKIYTDKANQYERDAYELVNLKLGYETETFDIYLYGKNIFDKEYNNDAYFDGFYTLYSDPGEIGLQVNYRF